MASEIATVGGGCFWCVEAVYEQLQGVEKVESGYSGGHTPNPNYRDVCSGSTGHAEVIRVTFDPSVLSYADLLRVFFTVHDPTTPNRQGNDVGTQYRSVIYFHSPEQKATAESVIGEMSSAFAAPIVTELSPAETFHPAEEYHRNYYQQNSGQSYCQYVVAPKLAKFRKAFSERAKR